jgi:hypothetical protein
VSDVAALIADMVRAGVDAELIGRAAAALTQNVQIVQNVQDPVADKRRAYDRNRKRNSTGIPPESAESEDKVSPKKEIPPTPPKEKTTPSNSLSVVAREFDEFWSLFPNKVGKRDAERAFANARSRAPLETILDGLRRYAAKADDRPWCNPATFLNQDRWADQPATPPPKQHSTASPPAQDFNAILDAIQGKPSHAAHPGQTIDGSHQRTDRGGAPGTVQLYAVPSGR